MTQSFLPNMISERLSNGPTWSTHQARLSRSGDFRQQGVRLYSWGRFWEGRFKAQPLLDETAIAACMAYVDLNPIRAKIASTLETSDFTSVQARIADRQAAGEATTVPAKDIGMEHGQQAGWLAPIALDPPRQRVREKSTDRRASNKGCLPMTLDQYLSLLDWTGRQIRKDKPGSMPAECAPILERLQCSAETWLDFVNNFLQRFRNEAGLAASRQAYRNRSRPGQPAPQAT